MPRVDTYPVGWMAVVRTTWNLLKHEWWYFRRMFREQNWRAIRNTFNGFLAEHPGCQHNAGRGITPKSAIRRVDKICAQRLQKEQQHAGRLS